MLTIIKNTESKVNTRKNTNNNTDTNLEQMFKVNTRKKSRKNTSINIAYKTCEVAIAFCIPCKSVSGSF